MLETVKASGVVDVEAAVKANKKNLKGSSRSQVTSWSEKTKHSQFLRQLKDEGADINGTWNLLKKADLKSSTKTLIRVA